MKTLLYEMEIRQEGFREGYKEGLELGRKLVKKVISMDMEGVSQEEIAKRLEITVEEVADILK